MKLQISRISLTLLSFHLCQFDVEVFPSGCYKQHIFLHLGHLFAGEGEQQKKDLYLLVVIH